MTKLAVTGAAGRMGRTIVQAAHGNPQFEVSCAVERAGSEFIGSDAGELAGVGHTGITVREEIADEEFDVLIEFTTPEATLEHVGICRARGKRMVIGTTGLDASQKAQVVKMAQDIAVVMAPNMSVGVNLCFYLVELAARALGESVDIEVIEAHHSQKVDAPSGTALKLGEIAASAVGRDLDKHGVYGRQGQIGQRDRKTIGFSTIRGGDIVGEHTVLFAGEGERVEICHRSSSRMNFANGALRAAGWCMNKQNGMYEMRDVLGLSS